MQDGDDLMGERYLHGNDVTTVNPARYWTDAIYKRDVDWAAAWIKIARDLDRVAYRGLVRAWLDRLDPAAQQGRMRTGGRFGRSA